MYFKYYRKCWDYNTSLQNLLFYEYSIFKNIIASFLLYKFHSRTMCKTRHAIPVTISSVSDEIPSLYKFHSRTMCKTRHTTSVTISSVSDEIPSLYKFRSRTMCKKRHTTLVTISSVSEKRSYFDFSVVYMNTFYYLPKSTAKLCSILRKYILLIKATCIPNKFRKTYFRLHCCW